MGDGGTDLISTGLAAHTIGCPVSTLKSLERDGRVLPATRVLGLGRDWRAWRRADLPELEQQVASLLRGNGRRRSAA